MKSRWWLPIGVALAAIACLVLPASQTGDLGAYTRALLVAFALFGAPGWLFCSAFSLVTTRSVAEAASVKFVTSIAVLLPSFVYPFLVGAALDAFMPAYCVTILILTTLACLRPAAPAEAEPDDEDTGRLVIMLVALLVLLLTVSAWNQTRTGSIDRWWYLAYVRSYLSSGALGFSEPFFGSEHIVARFGFNCWLVAMAVWAKLASVEPAWLYERACPLILVPLAFSSALFFGRSLFGPGRAAWLVVLASGLYWASGSLMPLSARLPEDKLLALLVIAPVTAGAFLTGVRRPRQGVLTLLAAAAATQATCHGLVYALVLASLVPFALLALATKHTRLSVVGPLLLVLALGAALPAYNGAQSKVQLRNDGATMTTPDHPVVRIHRSRARLVEFDNGLYMVKPQLLRHPLTLLALACLPLALWAPPLVRLYLFAATLIPLTVAFFPPLAAVAGALILPWMVYRILWVIPFTALLALATDRASHFAGTYRWVPVLVLVSVAMPWTVQVLGGSPRPERLDMVTPSEGPFAEAMKAIGKLDEGAVVAAAPEVSERIPALTGRRVLATSDRGTVVFTGNRTVAEERLRSRAAIMSGLWKAVEGVPKPTHVLFEPGSAAAVYCNETVFKLADFELCSFATTAPSPGVRLAPAPDKADGPMSVSLRDMLFDESSPFAAECSPPLDEDAPFLHWPRSGPWSARHPHMFCVLRARSGTGPATFRPRTLAFEPITGRAIDEFTISVAARREGQVRWRLRTRSRATNEHVQRYGFPRGDVDTLTINVFPEFLPFLKLERLFLTFDAAPGSNEG